ncbi:MAG TPA: hypothetical protein VHK89_03700, partial [Actinomycetota bacterium]|nr:hypothetical protein [Actinomycetota bacterium]
MNRIFRSAIFYLVLIIAVVWVFNIYRNTADRPQQLESVNAWLDRLGTDVDSVKFLTKDEKAIGTFTDGTRYEVFLPHGTIDEYATRAIDADVETSADPQAGSVLLSVLFQFVPILIIVGFFFFLMQQMQGGGNRVMSFGKAKA